MKRIFSIFAIVLMLVTASGSVFAKENDTQAYGIIEPRAYVCLCGTPMVVHETYPVLVKEEKPVPCPHHRYGEDVKYTYRDYTTYKCPNCGNTKQTYKTRITYECHGFD